MPTIGVVAKEATEDEIGDPLTVSQLCRRLLYLLPQNISQVPNPQGGKLLTLNSMIIIDAQNLQASKPSMGSLGGTLPPKRMPRMALQSTGSTPHLTSAKMKGPRVMKEPLHPAPHQGVPHVYVADEIGRAHV